MNNNERIIGNVCECGNDTYYTDGTCTECDCRNLKATGYNKISCSNCKIEYYKKYDEMAVCPDCECKVGRCSLATKEDFEKFYALKKEKKQVFENYSSKTKIINLTPHDINIQGLEPISSSGKARCKEKNEVIGKVGEIDIIKKEFGEVEGLPPIEDINVIYIVSLPIAQAVKGIREDCYIPGEIIRDNSGKIVGCKNLAKV